MFRNKKKNILRKIFNPFQIEEIYNYFTKRIYKIELSIQVSCWKSGINTQNSFLYQVFIIYRFKKTKTLKQYDPNFEKINANKSNLQKSRLKI